MNYPLPAPFACLSTSPGPAPSAPQLSLFIIETHHNARFSRPPTEQENDEIINTTLQTKNPQQYKKNNKT
jgi:hypothetical protein